MRPASPRGPLGWLVRLAGRARARSTRCGRLAPAASAAAISACALLCALALVLVIVGLRGDALDARDAHGARVGDDAREIHESVGGSPSIVALVTRDAPGGGSESGHEGEREAKEATHAPEIARERFLQRSSGGKIPMDGLFRAKQQIDAMRSAQADAGLWSDWEALGPGNIGGRIRAILVHPTVTSRIWVGGVSGGIWRSTNSGASWAPVNDFLANLSITSMVLDPTNPNRMYAGTGEGLARTGSSNTDVTPGAGVFKSSDGGATWAQLASTANDDWRYVNALEHHPTNANTLYAAIEDGSSTWSVQRTTDGGTNWTAVLTPDAPPADIEIQPGNPSNILVGCHATSTEFGQVWLSTNGGSSWRERTTGTVVQPDSLPDATLRCELAFGTGSYIYASLNRGLDGNGNGGEVWRSTNLGATWNKRSVTGLNYLSQGEYAHTLWVDPTWNEYVVVGGLDLFRSTTGGTSFTKISDWADFHNGGSANSAHADQHAIVPHPGYNGGSNRIVYFANDGGIQECPDIDLTTQNSGWVNRANNLSITQFYGGAAAPDGSVIVGGTQDNDKLRYRPADGANAWFQAESGDGGYCAVDYSDPDIIYGEYVRLRIFKSTDGGDTYDNISVNGITDAESSNTSLFISPFILDPNDPDILVAGGTSVWRTTDQGDSWTSIRGPISGNPKVSALSIKPGNSNEIWVGYTDGVISRTTNAGGAWSNVHTGVPDRWVMDLAASPHFINECIAVLSGYNADNVWITGNGGTSWSQRTGSGPTALPALQVNTVTYHPTDPDWIYIGTDLGVFASEDFGFTWNTTPAYQDNDGPANVEVDDLFWQGDEIIAATYGRGMFRTRPLPTVYVDISNVGVEDGTSAHPYDTVEEGVAAQGNGTNLSIRTGTYIEGANTFDRRGTVTATGGTVTVR